MSTAIWWIRRDLRLGDNQALSSALQQAEAVIPVFILDPHLLASSYVSQRRISFLFNGLRDLNSELRKRGSAMTVRRGDPEEELHQLLAETQAQFIFAEKDVSPYARQRDERVQHVLPLTLTPGLTVHPPETLVKPDGTAYTVFTPFSRKWHSLHFPGPPLPAPQRLPPAPIVATMGLPASLEGSAQSQFPAGELEAQKRLSAFIKVRLNTYAQDRNRMDLDGTSKLSPYIRFGMLSARQVAWAAREAIAQAGDETALHAAETWLNELIWREFYTAVVFHFPFVRKLAFRKNMRTVHWKNDTQGFIAWAEGRTGYPVVDAGMRQLNTTGWMHNRARMITASFLTKDLLINWRKGERYFMQHLVDGDPAVNNGGWQWTAGTGTDAAPYFRVFNPILQGKQFDPHAAYIRRWLPELSAVPDEYIHTPWKMPAALQVRLGCVIGKDYPFPIVDHAQARQRVMAAYRVDGE